MSGEEPVLNILTSTSLEAKVPAQLDTAQLLLAIIPGSVAKPFYQYDPQVVKVTACTPTAGRQIGAPVTIVSVAGLTEILAFPGLVLTTIKCRFGGLAMVQAEIAGLQSGLIKCLPSSTSSTGTVPVSATFNNGDQWLASTCNFTYLAGFKIQFGTQLDMPLSESQGVRHLFGAEITKYFSSTRYLTTVTA